MMTTAGAGESVAASEGRRSAAWLLVVIAGLIGAVTVVFAGGIVPSYGPTSGNWIDGAASALSFGAGGFLVAVGVAVAALFVGTGPGVRIAAIAVIVGTVLAAIVYGGVGAVARYAAAPKAAMCSDMGAAIDPRIQGAFDELQHPGWVDTLTASQTWCGVAVRNLSTAQASEFYGDQLVDAGWVIEEADDAHLIATRDGLTLTITACDTESWMEITTDGSPPQGC